MCPLVFKYFLLDPLKNLHSFFGECDSYAMRRRRRAVYKCHTHWRQHGMIGYAMSLPACVPGRVFRSGALTIRVRAKPEAMRTCGLSTRCIANLSTITSCGLEVSTYTRSYRSLSRSRPVWSKTRVGMDQSGALRGMLTLLRLTGACRRVRSDAADCRIL